VFTDKPKVTAAPLVPGVHAFVVDNALADPDALVQFATKARAAFKPASPNVFPGIELRMAESFSTKFEEFFRQHLKSFFDARRTIECITKLGMQTAPVNELEPCQWLPQYLGSTSPREQTLITCVLYLFHDESHGGTGFFLPSKQMRDTAQLLGDSYQMNRSDFERVHHVSPGYPTQSSEHFHLAKVVSPRYNRMVVFDGAMFHAEQIGMPDKLTSDPATGRLTFNAFLSCRRHSDGFANRRRY
jgi:hypothetical protein